MKKNILLMAGIGAMLFAYSPTDVRAEVGIRIGVGDGDRRDGDRGDRFRGDRHRGRLDFVIDTRPDFIFLQERGFYVSVGSPYDIIYYGNRYYLYRDGSWYLSPDYRGPWILVMDYDLPYRIRRHRVDIWRYRDVEYRRHDRGYWEERNRRYDHGPRDERGPRGDEHRDGWDGRRDGGRDGDRR